MPHIGVHLYFGQPSAGFFFCRDFLIAARQSPLILSTSGFGPGMALPFLLAFFFIVVVTSPDNLISDLDRLAMESTVLAIGPALAIGLATLRT